VSNPDDLHFGKSILKIILINNARNRVNSAALIFVKQKLIKLQLNLKLNIKLNIKTDWFANK